MPTYRSKFVSLPDDSDFIKPISEGPFSTDPVHVANLLRERGLSIDETTIISSIPRIVIP